MRKYVPVVFVALLAAGAAFIFVVANAGLAPTVAQTRDDLMRAHAMQRFAPFATLILAAIGTFVTIRSWKERSERLYRAVSLLPVLALVVVAVGARRPIVERMFAPIEQARFVAAAEASFLEPEALVLGVAVGRQSKAYPISMMAYHHLVNDELAGEAFVATY